MNLYELKAKIDELASAGKGDYECLIDDYTYGFCELNDIETDDDEKFIKLLA
jgi:hypothetical protein